MSDLFQRGVYDKDFEEKYVLHNINRIEEIYKHFSQIPQSDKVKFYSESAVNKIIESKNIEEYFGVLFYEIYNRLKFLFYTSIYKTIKLVDGLALMYNTKNYLGWTTLGRSVLEHSAILWYFYINLDKYNLQKNKYSIEELQEIEILLIRYTNGTRFDWDNLISGNFDNITKDYKPEENYKAINVLTALQKISKLEIFKHIEITYNMLSDFAHPNMASNSVFIDITKEAYVTGENALSLDVNERRGQFIVVATIESITLNIANMAKFSSNLSPIVEYWLNNILLNGKVEIVNNPLRK